MNKKTLFLMMALTAGTAVQAQDKLSSFRVSEGYNIRKPILSDSINYKGDKLTEKQLLHTSISSNLMRGTTTIAQADTAGLIRMAKAQDGNNLLYLASTRMRAANFMKGSLKITSPVRWEVFVNGASRQSKESAEKDMASAQAQNVALTLEPEADYEIVIKLLSTPEDPSEPALKVEWIKDAAFKDIAFQAAPDLKKRFRLDNTEFGNRVIGVSVSPDGRYLLTRYWDRYDLKRSVVHCELSELKTGKVLFPDVKDGLKWMPRTNKLYYTRTAREGFDIVTVDPATLKEEVIATQVPRNSFTWAPTEDYLIYYVSESTPEEKGPLKRLAVPEDRLPGSRQRSFLCKYDLKTGLTERLTYGYRTTYMQDISHDGRYLLFSSSEDRITKRPFGVNSLYRLDLQTMQVDTIISKEPFLGGASFSSDDSQLLLTGGPEAFGAVGKNCGNHPIPNDYDKQAFIMDLATRKIDPITKDFDPSVSLLQWNQGDGNIYFRADDEDCVNIYRYTPKTRAFEKLDLKVDVTSGFSLSETNPAIAAYYGQGNTYSGVAYTYDMKKKTSRLVADPMKPILDEITLGKMEPWNFKTADGTEIKGMMCLPPDFDPDKKYPMIVYYYGGTTPTTRGISSPYCAQLFASRDYVVYVIQPSGTIGFGQEFSARHVNAWGKRTADEIIEGTQRFCKEHPFVDEKRIGCIGASYGGFMTQYLQTKTNIFAAAVSHAGISNVTSYWGEGYWGYGYNAVAAADSYPWNNPDLFTKQGSLFNADKINTPLLLLHGTADTNVPIGESIQLFNALRILGKTVEFITVDGENHFISDYPKRIQWHNSIMAWFERWLQGKPAWWNEMYPEKHL